MNASNPLSGMSRRAALGAMAATALTATAAAGAATAAAAPAAGTRTGAADAVLGTGTRSFPSTRLRQSTESGPLETGFPLSHVAVQWTGAARGGRIRFLSADGAPGPWQKVQPGCVAGKDTARGGAQGHSAVSAMVAAPARAYGYEIEPPSDAADVRSVALDTVAGPQRSQVRTERRVPRWATNVPYLSRADWGADESLRFLPDGTENTPTAYYPAQVMSVHHTAGRNDDPDPAATVRAIYAYHALINDWGDIGYHFLIDAEGRVYEGRWSGTDGTPAHNSEGKLVTAFHAAGYNSGNLGVALLGTYTDRAPSAAARASLVTLLAAHAQTHGLDATATTTFVNPVNGVTKKNPVLSGHRDWLTTECPGGTLYADLPKLRTLVGRPA
jgi:hypothetical protein